ncbi:glutamine amidotransferase [Ureibacillus massiliensis 4400831 = CIP 108448 = CCUG 49529]|uniref:Pyridoxal 5'-phosphate synthase subunit PdxT n=1 Tax=Ureibacillus massiliensis 4400831 = CIP 108448 = CCUG 49529 TaxID=1211035 RepID=A0A0A3IY42_9BACL|nr:pyridoxal 5'-phosphate synthase glutaminase subunit PdxT [Ureibacillus massiliensis]KGR89704.1 glutamine amidotransferase [Ureibacillus massiliensis 4400831 = CIP 108448 = CCUG 49529]
MTKIGVLALQGAVREHIRHIELLGCEAIAIKTIEDLNGLDGLILPGGESTTMRKLLDRYRLLKPIQTLAQQGIPTFGTCAGLILLAKKITGFEKSHLGIMDVVVERNSFGRQLDSFEVELSIPSIGDDIPAVFIRAPHIVSTGDNVEILATFENRIVLAKDGQFLGCSFHPELTEDVRVLQYFINMVNDYTKSSRTTVNSI